LTQSALRTDAKGDEMAMGPRINKHLKLSGGNKITVKGPVGKWEPYAVSATFAVVVGQVNEATGKIVLAVGRSDPGEEYKPGGKTVWDADAEVFDPANGVLVDGPAVAWGIAAVEMQDGKHEAYGWSVKTRLVSTAQTLP
jgi:hypothetical protein